jgi:ABC-2 type transport system permease protein
MRNTWLICRKEIRSYFVSPVAYLLLALFAILFGYFYFRGVSSFVRYGMAMQMRGEMIPMNINEDLLRPLLSNAGVLGLFLLPLITMRLFAEEKRTGTIELLVTSPVRDYEIVLGKWVASVLLYSAMLFLPALNLVWLFKYGNPDWKPLAVGYLGLVLQAGGLLAIGAFISSLTRNQIVAGGATFGVALLLWVAGWGDYDQGTASQVFSYLSLVNHYESFAKGVLSLKDGVFYVSMIFLGLFLTTRSLESLRWKS